MNEELAFKELVETLVEKPIGLEEVISRINALPLNSKKDFDTYPLTVSSILNSFLRNNNRPMNEEVDVYLFTILCSLRKKELLKFWEKSL